MNTVTHLTNRQRIHNLINSLDLTEWTNFKDIYQQIKNQWHPPGRLQTFTYHQIQFALRLQHTLGKLEYKQVLQYHKASQNTRKIGYWKRVK